MNKHICSLKMKIIVITVLFFCLQKSNPETHSLTFQLIGSEGGHFPAFMETWIVDGVPIYRYNSSVGMETMNPAPDWLNNPEGRSLWQEMHVNTRLNKTLMSNVLNSACQHANITGTENNAFQIYQALGYCHLNSDGTRQAYMAHAFNGHDYVSFDVETQTWTAAMSSAVFYKRKREADQFDIIRLSYLYRYLCTEMLKTVLKYAPWVKERKGGLPLVEGVRSGEVLPNGDGTYQLRPSLTVSEEAQTTQSYSCLVIHSSVSENITVTWVPESDSGVGKIIAIVAVLGLILILAVIFCIIKNRKESVV